MAKLKSDMGEETVEDGDQIVTAAENLGVTFGCYAGHCGACKIEITEGEENLDELTEEETKMGRDRKHRLACQCKIKSGTVVFKTDN